MLPCTLCANVPQVVDMKIVIISFSPENIPKWKMVKGTVAEYDIHPLYPDEFKIQSLSLSPNPCQFVFL
jgi:hypothetical protein